MSYDPSIDDDIFDDTPSPPEASASRHVTDGSVCPACGITHTVEYMDPEGKEMPGLQEAIDDFLDDAPPGAVASRIVVKKVDKDAPRVALLLEKFARFISAWGEQGWAAASHRTMLTVLDEVTGGRATIIYEFHKTENKLLFARFLNSMLRDTHRDMSGLLDHHQQLLQSIDMITEIISVMIEQYTVAYQQTAERASMVCNDLLLSEVNSEQDDSAAIRKLFYTNFAVR